MTLAFFLKGLVVGFSLAAPVGPIGLLCIRRSLAEGRLIGLATGLGAATADATYAAVAGFGLTAVSTFLVTQKVWLGVIGGGFLCVMGTRTFLAPPAHDAARARGNGSLWSAYGSTFFLTLTNPMTILRSLRSLQVSVWQRRPTMSLRVVWFSASFLVQLCGGYCCCL